MDIMIDADGNPFLLEVNHTPSFATDTDTDYTVKYRVIRDVCKLLDIQDNSR